jgi:hypothetical protein
MSRNRVSFHLSCCAVRLAAAVLLLAAVAGPTQAAADAPLFTFVQLNDTHVDTTVPNNYQLANDKMQYVIGAINAQTNFPLPNFVLGVGDIIDGGALADLQPDFNTVLPMLAQLNVSFYPAMGNHDDVQMEGNAQYQAAYKAAFGDNRVNYTFMAGGIEFVVLDDSGAPNTNSTSVGIARRSWLQGVLEATPGVPKIIATHIPMVSMRDTSKLSASFGFSSYAARDTAMLALVEQHSDDVIAVLSGHVHLTGAVQQNGIYHITTSGLASYPCDYGYYAIYPDRIHVQMYGLPAELSTPATDIHGPPRWTTAYTDSTHLTHEAYVKGNPSERSFDIFFDALLPLPGDANRDGSVNGTDLSTVLSNYSGSFSGDTWSSGDFDGNGTVNGADLNVVLSNYNQHNSTGSAVPEPSALLLAAAGLAGLLCRVRMKRKRSETIRWTN